MVFAHAPAMQVQIADMPVGEDGHSACTLSTGDLLHGKRYKALRPVEHYSPNPLQGLFAA